MELNLPALLAALVFALACPASLAGARGGGHSVVQGPGGGRHTTARAEVAPSSSTTPVRGGAPSAVGHGPSMHQTTVPSAATTYGGVKRDVHGKIARDPHAKEAFRKAHPCPATGKTYGACPGWTVDHVQALKHGGPDDPSNMQWQTAAEAKAKDRWE